MTGEVDPLKAGGVWDKEVGRFTLHSSSERLGLLLLPHMPCRSLRKSGVFI